MATGGSAACLTRYGNSTDPRDSFFSHKREVESDDGRRSCKIVLSTVEEINHGSVAPLDELILKSL